MNSDFKKESVGIGLRHTHFPDFCSRIDEGVDLGIGWLEAIAENFIDTKGRPIEVLKKVREHYPISLHGVSLSIAGPDPIDQKYLMKLKSLYKEVDPFLVSDHLCWTGVAENKLHNLLPLPYTADFLKYLVPRVKEVQETLERKISLENLSAYFTVKGSEMTEWEFLNEIHSSSGCGILLDINNIYVNAMNQGFCPNSFIDNINVDAVTEVHLAGHSDRGDFLFDTHSEQVSDEVWKLYRRFLGRKKETPTLIEWDENIPTLDRLIEEAFKAQEIIENV
jgi:uncharacterized protein (UPF0276 family)